MIILLFVVIFIFVLFRVGSDSGNTSNTNATPATTLKQENTVKNTVPPIGKKLSWDNISDISFALGSFMVGLDASGFIGAYENGTLTFNIRNFTPAFSSINERVPSDIIEFLAMNPSIIKRKQLGDTIIYQLEFSRSFPVISPRTKENIERSTEDILKAIQRNLQDGADMTAEITGAARHFSFRVESPEYTASRTLWVK